MDELSPYEFDQTHQGWRLLDSEQKFLEAAKAIELYIASHLEEIRNQNLVSAQTMYFHAGQEYAMAGIEYYRQAVFNFKKSYKSNPGWDIYVEGTIAFLEKNADALQKAADKLVLLAETDKSITANSQLLRQFLKALPAKRDYATIYEAN